MKLQPTAASSRRAGFTMVEIAICLAIIGFALVAIIGILPTGMRAQKDNREETIINKDATFLMEALRSGSLGTDLLTNHLEYITVSRTTFDLNGNNAETFTVYSNAWLRPTTPLVPATSAPIPIVSPQEMLGILSTPRFEPFPSGFRSNYVAAYLRAISGVATDKGINQSSRDFAFHYRLVPEIVPSGWTALQRFWTQTNGVNVSSNQLRQLTAEWNRLRTTATNLQEVRLLFRWPVYQGINPTTGEPRIGKGRQVYRTLFGGTIARIASTKQPDLYFLQPSVYTQVDQP